MLPVVGVMFTFHPALVLMVLSGAMLMAGLMYLSECFVYYYHKQKKGLPPKWHILVEVLLFFIFNLIVVSTLAETHIFKIEIIRTLSHGL